MAELNDQNAVTIPRVTMNLFRGCLVATLQVDLTPRLIEQFQRDLLDLLAESHATRVIFDCSGLEIIDPEEFESLCRVTTMARLLGARVVMAGLRPGVVASLIALGITGDGVLTALSLDDAFEVHEQAEQSRTPGKDEHHGNTV